MPRRRQVSYRRRSAPSWEQVGLLLLVLVAVWSLAVGAVRWLVAHPWVPTVLLLVALAAGGVWVRRYRETARWNRVREQGLRYALPQIDALHHRQFEEAVRDLMRRDGCPAAIRVGGAGDNGADVKATDPFGRLWVIQCKHRKAGLSGSAVGTPDLHVLNGTGRPVHNGDVVVLVTNGRFTDKAIAFARSQRLHLVDRHLLARWAGGSDPLWELLSAVPSHRRRASGS
ncbi:restriction endonuclease [Streptomyces hydrogenans]|uniref:Restriction endonuclease n=1 Tax=Streptomyces hydrogenans TaxID=1873719 RepID=A0ABQ3PQQ9_9ACTN|nr:restriction endonuclease [Streptomyces hydrogenans]GHI27339.1 restriction endonuclease [Streptomyces hydrogenans]